MKYARLLVAASLGMLAACSGLNEAVQDGELVDQVIFEVPVLRSLGEDGATRASLTQDEDDAIHFAWEATDTVGIYPDQGAQVFFEMTDGAGTNIAVFDGGGWALRKESTYSCYYPFSGSIYLKRDAIPVSFADQKQAGVSDYTGIRFYLASESTKSASGALRFSFQYLNTIIRIKPVGLPAGTYTKLSISTEEPLFVQKGSFGLDDMTIVGEVFSNSLEVSLKDFTLTEASSDENPVFVFLTSAPVDLTGKTVTVQVLSEDGIVYTCEKTPSYAYEAAGWGALRCEMKKIEPEPVGNMESLDDTDDEIDI